MFVRLSVCVFRSYQKSQYHEILAQGIVWGEVRICLKFKWQLGCQPNLTWLSEKVLIYFLVFFPVVLAILNYLNWIVCFPFPLNNY